jgi:hypothetical protein
LDEFDPAVIDQMIHDDNYFKPGVGTIGTFVALTAAGAYAVRDRPPPNQNLYQIAYPQDFEGEDEII